MNRHAALCPCGASLRLAGERAVLEPSTSRARSIRLAEQIAAGIERAGLLVELSAPVTDHGASDDAGPGTLGDELEPFWRDHKGAGMNAIPTQTLIRNADVVVVRFGDRYRQWNAAFDAGYAAALGKPVGALHDTDLDHALKEVDRGALATARSSEQVVDVLRYVIEGKLPG
jgi:YtoQ family protein